MGQIGGENKSAVLPLARLLEDPDPQIRSEAALALGRLGFPAKPVMPLLVRAEKNDDDEHVRSQAAMALESIRAARPDGREKRFPWSLCMVGVLLAGGAAAWARRDWIKAEWGPVVTRRLERMLP
jgi:hypothetical protein